MVALAQLMDMTSADAALKVHYEPLRVKNQVYKDRPGLALVPKMTKFGGKNLPIPVQFGIPQGVGVTVLAAQTARTQSLLEDFVLTRKKKYGVARIDGETMDASRGDVNAFMEMMTTEIDGIIHTLSNELAVEIYGDGNGTRGTISTVSGAANGVIVLTNFDDIVNFEVGMEIEARDTAGATRLPVSAQIVNINRDTGTLTLDDDLDAGANDWAATDTLHRLGDYGAVLTGLRGWLPSTRTVAFLDDAFFGVDRSQDATRLAGVYYDGSSETIEEALLSAGARLGREGGRPDVVLLNPVRFADLVKALGSKVVYDRIASSDEARIGFDAIRLMTPRGIVKVVADPFCPSNDAFMLTMNTWKLYSLGDAPRILDGDGLKWLRISDQDHYEVRVGYYAQMGCVAPGWNARIKLA